MLPHAKLCIYDEIRNGQTDRQVEDDLRRIGQCDTLKVFIDSNGGHVRALNRIQNAIQNHPARQVETICVGRCYSAAAVLFLAGDKRTMHPDGKILLHAVHIDGKEQDSDHCAATTDSLVTLLASCTKLDRRQISAWMHDETVFNFTSALKWNLATGTTACHRLRTRPTIPSNFIHAAPERDLKARDRRDYTDFTLRRLRRQAAFEEGCQRTPAARRVPIVVPPLPRGAVTSTNDLQRYLRRVPS